MISDLPLPVSPVSRFNPGPKRTVDSATRARSRTLSSLSTRDHLLLGDQGPSPPQLVGQPCVEALRRAEPHDLQAPLLSAAPAYIAGRHRASSASSVDAHLGRSPHELEGDVLAGCAHDR